MVKLQKMTILYRESHSTVTPSNKFYKVWYLIFHSSCEKMICIDLCMFTLLKNLTCDLT